VRLINERSGREFTAFFETVGGDPQVPGTAHWRLVRDAMGSVTVLQDWTPETPEVVTDASGGITGIKISINVDGMHHRMTEPRLRRDPRQLQVVADMDSPREYSQVEDYYVQAMAGGRS
jgi:hypothetical protein